MFGWLLLMLGQDHGWPVPAGGAGAITSALVQRLASRGGVVRCATPAESIVIRDGTRAEDNLTRAVELTRLVVAANTAAATGSTMSYRISAV